MNGCFCRNTLLANAALILLCYVWGVFIDPCPRGKLLRRQSYGDCIPELGTYSVWEEASQKG